MNAKDLLRYNLELTHSVTTQYLEDVSDEEMLVRAVPGSNHIAWQLGHLISAERFFLQSLGFDAPALPEGFDEAHGRENAGCDDPASFLSKAEYLELMAAMHAAAGAAIDQVGEADLDRPAPEAVRGYFPTVGAVLLMAGGHEMMHTGQIAAIRRKLGKPVVI